MKKSVIFISSIIGILILAFYLTPATAKPDLLHNLDFSTAIYDESHHLLRLNLTNDAQYRLFTPLTKIDPLMIEATLLKEDEHFYQHHGVNIPSIAAAFWQTYILQQQRRGASTITMQVARLRYALPTHTILGKIKQIARALYIENIYSKQQILEAYFNLAPYGNNIQGVGAASLIYYHKDAKKLTLPEALTLSIIPQSPSRRRLDYLNYDWIKSSRLNLFARWVDKHPEDKNRQSIMSLPITNYTRAQLPFLAPHFVLEVKKQARSYNAKQSEVVTTLNLSLQKTLERVIKQTIQSSNNNPIQNASALLVDVNDMSVKALVGSADFNNATISGQVDGTSASRSPGSLLKPFVYGLAIDQGLIHPATVLKDAPMSFGSYNPENFDYAFLGPITAKEALIQSRNIPAVYLANRLKKPSFYQFLLQAGLNLRKESDYGLALVLGGAEISMRKSVELYAMLRNQGVLQPLNFTKNTVLAEGQRLLSPEASYLVLDMLQGARRNDLIYAHEMSNQFPIAWKTGTSSGYRDAWVVGIFSHYVLAVWVGNFSGEGNKAFTGRDAAAPLFFSMIDNLQRQMPTLKQDVDNWKNLHITKVTVCKASGMLPTHACPMTATTWFIPGKSPIQKDTVYREIMINPKTGKRSCHFDPTFPTEVFEFWSSDLLRVFAQAGVERKTPPPYDEGCNTNDKIAKGSAPAISSPKAMIQYIARDNNPVPILLSASVEGDVEKLHWFANEKYIGSHHYREPFWWQASPGKYTVRIVDDYGRADAVDVVVAKLAV